MSRHNHRTDFQVASGNLPVVAVPRDVDRYSVQGTSSQAIFMWHGRLAHVLERSDLLFLCSVLTIHHSALNTPPFTPAKQCQSAPSHAPAQNKPKNPPPRPRHRGPSAKQTHAQPRPGPCPTMPQNAPLYKKLSPSNLHPFVSLVVFVLNLPPS